MWGLVNRLTRRTYLKNTREERIIELLGIGMTVRDVAEEVGVSKSQVHRIKKKGEMGGANAE